MEEDGWASEWIKLFCKVKDYRQGLLTVWIDVYRFFIFS